MNPRSLILDMIQRFRAAGVPDPETDSAFLLAFLCGRNPLSLRLDTETELDQDTVTRYMALCERRICREPLQYITGECRFCGSSFLVTPDVLIPRPETELLCEWAVEKMAGRVCPKILDLCCGSGCIGITLKLRLPSSSVLLSDLSEAAAAVAQKNAERLSADISVRTGNLFENICGHEFDLIISNPPYIPGAECRLLQEEVMREPVMALDGGRDGLNFYRRICREAAGYLRKNGILMFELGEGQHNAVERLMNEAGFDCVEIRKDFQQISRMISGVKS